MIAVFNQFKTSWIIRNSQDPELFTFSKLKKFTDETNEPRKAFLRVNVAASVIDKDKTIDVRLANMSQMKDIQVLLDEKVTVNFDPKTYDPTLYINSKKAAPSKKILLLSMFMRNYKVLEVSTKDVFILENLDRDEFFGMVISFNSDYANTSITAYNESTRTLDTHVFTIVEGMIHYEKITTRDTEPDSLKERRIRKFKPARLTRAILVSKDAESSLAHLVEYKGSEDKFDVINIDLSEPTFRLPEMKAEGYKAATLLIPSSLSPEQTERYELFIRDAKRYFRVFYTVREDNRITKIKVN